MEFIGRSEELGFLESQYRMDHPLTMVTGRRRVGKSTLILEFLKGRNAMYFEANRETGRMIMQSFSSEVSRSVGRTLGAFDAWEDAIRAYVELAPPGRKVLAIDEFQYISMADPEFLRTFQGIWDTYLSREDVMVILCGSYLNMMRRMSEDYGSPLYGRNTGDLMLPPLAFHETSRGKDYRRAVEEYAVTGGVPYYMLLMDDDTVIRNVERLTMGLGAPLLSEPAYLLSDEFRDPSSYNTYLRAIAEGNRKADRITSAVQAPSSAVMPYLRKLMDVGMLERRVPVTEDEQGHSRNGMYLISDRFMALWFRFVYPYHNRILRRDPDIAMADLEDHFIDSHVAFVFEDICRDELRRFLRSNGILARYGSYWDRSIELDVVAVDDRNGTVYVGECKYHGSPIGPEVLRKLKAKCSKVRPFEGMRVVTCVFSASGYTEGMLAESRDSLLFDRGELIAGHLDPARCGDRDTVMPGITHAFRAHTVRYYHRDVGWGWCRGIGPFRGESPSRRTGTRRNTHAKAVPRTTILSSGVATPPRPHLERDHQV